MVPLLMDFHTPPFAAPTHTVFGSLLTASMHVIRPLILAGPICLPVISPRVASLTWPSRLEAPARIKMLNRIGLKFMIEVSIDFQEVIIGLQAFQTGHHQAPD